MSLPATTAGQVGTPAHPLYIPGTSVIARDEEWMITAVDYDHGMTWLDVRGQSGIVRDTTAKLSPDLEPIQTFSPADTELVPDNSPQYRRNLRSCVAEHASTHPHE